MSWMTTPTPAKLEYVLNIPWRCWLILLPFVTYFIQSNCPLENHNTMLLNYCISFSPSFLFPPLWPEGEFALSVVWNIHWPFLWGVLYRNTGILWWPGSKAFLEYNNISIVPFSLNLCTVILFTVVNILFHSISILLFPFRASSCYFSKQFDILNSR